MSTILIVQIHTHTHTQGDCHGDWGMGYFKLTSTGFLKNKILFRHYITLARLYITALREENSINPLLATHVNHTSVVGGQKINGIKFGEGPGYNHRGCTGGLSTIFVLYFTQLQANQLCWDTK